MKLASFLACISLVVLLAATCSRRDELVCVEPEKMHHCQMECMARRCGEPFFHYEPGRIEVPMCATDSYAALAKFWQITSQLDIKDCGDPSCTPTADTGSSTVLTSGNSSAGSVYHEQGETESAAATGGWWEPVPGETCMP